MIKAAVFALYELSCIGFFLWSSYFLAHLAAGAA